MPAWASEVDSARPVGPAPMTRTSVDAGNVADMGFPPWLQRAPLRPAANRSIYTVLFGTYRTVSYILTPCGVVKKKAYRSVHMSVSPPTRRDRKRSEIVAIAKQIFFEEGYAGASMAQIAARVGGSKATLYSHFPSKQDLFLAVVTEVAEQQPLAEPPTPEQLAGVTKDASAFRKWLQQFGADSLRRLTSYELLSLQRLAAAEAARLPEVGRAFYDGYVLPVFQHFAPVFSAAMANGVIRRAPAEQAAEHFSELCLGWMLRAVIWGLKPAPSDAEIAAHVKHCVTAFMDGYGKR